MMMMHFNPDFIPDPDYDGSWSPPCQEPFKLTVSGLESLTTPHDGRDYPVGSMTFYEEDLRNIIENGVWANENQDGVLYFDDDRPVRGLFNNCTVSPRVRDWPADMREKYEILKTNDDDGG
jgi:hypothetical protein